MGKPVTTRELVDAMFPARSAVHQMDLAGEPPNNPVRFAASCTCGNWTSGYYHHDEIAGKLSDALTNAHYTHRTLRRRTTT